MVPECPSELCALRALRPPALGHLASPTALLALRCGASENINVGNRVAACWFDQLRLPVQLRCHTGRLKMSVDELRMIGGLSVDEIAAALENSACRPQGSFTPSSRTWPMWFSWSSAVAQSYLLAICEKSGLRSSGVLACDVRSPADLGLTHAAATDDMILSVRGRIAALDAAERIDRSFESEGGDSQS